MLVQCLFHSILFSRENKFQNTNLDYVFTCEIKQYQMINQKADRELT